MRSKVSYGNIFFAWTATFALVACGGHGSSSPSPSQPASAAGTPPSVAGSAPAPTGGTPPSPVTVTPSGTIVPNPTVAQVLNANMGSVNSQYCQISVTAGPILNVTASSNGTTSTASIPFQGTNIWTIDTTQYNVSVSDPNHVSTVTATYNPTTLKFTKVTELVDGLSFDCGTF